MMSAQNSDIARERMAYIDRQARESEEDSSKTWHAAFLSPIRSKTMKTETPTSLIDKTREVLAYLEAHDIVPEVIDVRSYEVEIALPPDDFRRQFVGHTARVFNSVSGRMLYVTVGGIKFRAYEKSAGAERTEEVL